MKQSPEGSEFELRKPDQKLQRENFAGVVGLGDPEGGDNRLRLTKRPPPEGDGLASPDSREARGT